MTIAVAWNVRWPGITSLVYIGSYIRRPAASRPWPPNMQHVNYNMLDCTHSAASLSNRNTVNVSDLLGIALLASSYISRIVAPYLRRGSPLGERQPGSVSRLLRESVGPIMAAGLGNRGTRVREVVSFVRKKFLHTASLVMVNRTILSSAIFSSCLTLPRKKIMQTHPCD
ncbi:hypothetical protein WN51_05240 [Melipona quadrifasciata]|uniref:Uncharacterized protein n=1 Tax=Melipona quadrifasciata TaxID=166423 RepID=A0A0M8ZVY1_9HYME|nr:hypothetical protein WN51_05240 [Melipona quadrifasciata]